MRFRPPLVFSRCYVRVKLVLVGMVEFAPWKEACCLISPCVDVFFTNGVSVLL